MPSILDLIRPTPESIQNMIMQSRMNQQPAQPVAIGDDSDYLAALQSTPQYRAPTRTALPSPSFEPTSGSKMEAESRSSIDDLMAQLASQRDQYRQQDKNQQWMSFFSKLASSKDSTLLGGLGEGAQALTDVTGKQNANNQLLDQAALQDQVKYREWQQEQKRAQQVADQTGAYQQRELGLKREALGPENDLKKAQAEYYKAKPLNNPATNVTLSPQSIDYYADAISKGATASSLGLGYGQSANKMAILNRVAEKYPDVNLADAQIDMVGNKAGARTVGTAGGKVELSGQSLKSMIPLAKEAAAQIDSTEYPSINAIQNAVSKGTGDKKIVALNTYLNAVMADHAALLVRNGVATDSARQTAHDMANTAMTNGQLNTYFDAVTKEIDAQNEAIKNARGAYRTGAIDKKGKEAATESAAPAAASKKIHFNDLPE